jgi:hypothetical protein
MATIVPGLFGKTSVDVEAETQKRIDDFLNISRQRTGPGSEKARLGASSGILLGKALKGLFGVKNADEKAALKNEDMAKYLNQISSDEEKASPYRYTSLAADVAEKFGELEKAQALRLSAAEKKSDYDKNQSVMDYQKANTQKVEQEVEKSRNDYLGLLAYGANEALQSTDDPTKRKKIWDNVITSFEKRGADVSMYKDLPDSEWEKALEMVSVQSTDVIGLKKLEYAAAKEERALATQEETKRHNLKMEALSEKRINLTDEIARLNEKGRDTRSKNKELSDIDKMLNKTTMDSAWTSNKSEITNLSNKIVSRELRSELKSYTELEGSNLITGLADFKANYSKYLNQANDKGFPLYTMEEAKALALKDVKSKITTEGMIFKDKVYTPGVAPEVKTPTQEMKRPDKFTVGKVYKDTSGNEAVYKGDNQWDPVKK